MKITKIIPSTFLSKVSEDLGLILSGTQIIRKTVAFAGDYGVTLPHNSVNDVSFKNNNKRVAFYENLMQLPDQAVYDLILSVCAEIQDSEMQDEKEKEVARKTKNNLLLKYGKQFSNGNENSAILVDAIESTPKVDDLIKSALENKEIGKIRNSIDDIRVAIELQLKDLLNNSRSLEKNIDELLRVLKSKETAPETRNLAKVVLDYFSAYNNSNVKHDDNIHDDEYVFIYEQGLVLINFLKRISKI